MEFLEIQSLWKDHFLPRHVPYKIHLYSHFKSLRDTPETRENILSRPR
jgi:hypothetical protein